MTLINSATRENIRIAFGAIRSQKLRAILTMSIIAVGIMCLVGIITITSAMENKINSEFSTLGSNTFTVYSANSRYDGGHGGEQKKSYGVFSYEEAKNFTERFKYDAYISMSAFGGMMVVKNGSKKTNPNITLLGCDNGYFALSSYEIDAGRNFSMNEMEHGSNVVILGKDITDKVFESSQNPIGLEVTLGDQKYLVIGTLLPKGNTFGMAGDNQCMIPISNLRKNFAGSHTEYAINVRVKNADQLDNAVSEAKGVLRQVRKDKPGESDSFEIEMSDSLVEELTSMTSSLTTGASVIGIITLLSAGIGLMNIMLVSVSERTREIGTANPWVRHLKLFECNFLSSP
ncbi:MAG: ABC transporter permease [Flavobacteriales bacterium]|nr:ABC transporter permease [Flavobacteriales bacterium]